MTSCATDALRLVPLYPEAAEAFWLEDRCAAELLGSTLASLAAQGETLVATDSPAGAELAVRAGARARLIARADDAGYLPPGSAGALLAAHDENPQRPVLLVDFRLAGDLAGLAARFRPQDGAGQGRVLASVSAPQDHPVQFMRCASYSGMAVVHLFAGEELLAGVPCWRSRPCRLLPPGVTAAESSDGSFWLARTLSDGAPRKAGDCAQALLAGEPLAAFDSQRATLYFPQAPLRRLVPGQTPLGASLFAHGGAQAVLTATPGGGTLHFPDTPPDCQALLLPRPAREGVAEQCLRMDAEIPLDFVPQGDVLPLLLLRCPEVSAQGIDQAELRLPFTPDGDLWAEVGGVAFCRATGQKIVGRQQFPPCREVDGWMCAGVPGDLLRFEELLLRGEVHGVEEDCGPAGAVRRIANRLDFLCFEEEARP